jgi:hypothetical protein
MKVARIDGSLNAKERQAEVARFQRIDSISVFLLTTQVGGLGLTITAANRVIIVDPSWNPAQDNQVRRGEGLLHFWCYDCQDMQAGFTLGGHCRSPQKLREAVPMLDLGRLSACRMVLLASC